ncbi:MAG: tetratricopeptide repeat protein [Planctomycetota bacterium]|nr:tetratricopeptide repeat protein [Planctomycetota bacterium]
MQVRAAILLGTTILLGAHAPAEPTRPAAGRSVAGAPEDRESLQAYLLRLRQQRDLILGAMQGQVQGLVEDLEGHATARNLEGLDAARAKLVQLGPEVAPLLVEHLDPGTSPTDPQRLRASSIALVLAELQAGAITAKLLEIVQSGSVEGRQNAIRVLATSPEPDRAAPALVGIYRAGLPELRGAALAALARLGGPAAKGALEEALGDARPEVVRAALDALAQAKNGALANRILRITATPGDAFRVLDPLLGWYRAVADSVDGAHVAALVKLAADPSAPAVERARVLEVLPRFADKFDSDVKKSLRSIAESPAREMREGALVVLVLAGDKNARRDLLAEFDERIAKNEGYAAAYEERGNVYYRIGDYREGVNDFKQAIKLSADDLRARQDTAYVGLAKCYARWGKLKEAAQTLEKAPLTRQQLADLKNEPAFAKLLENAKFRELFEIR